MAWATSGEVREARGAAQLQRHIAVALDSDVAEQQLRRQLHLLLQHADAGADADANAGVGVAHPPGGGSATKERWSPFKNVSAPFTLPNAAAAVAVAGAGRAAAAAKAANDEAWAEAAVAEVGLDDEGGERGQGGEGGARRVPKPAAEVLRRLVCDECQQCPMVRGAGLKRCAGCRAVYYCTRVDAGGRAACQLEAWGEHKAACKAAVRERKRVEAAV